jgi:hypothetical protein
MFGKKLAMLAAVAALVPAQAMAQQPAPKANLVSDKIVSHSLFSEAAQGGGGGAVRKLIPRVFAGGIVGEGDANGFEVGAGVSSHPFTDSRHEIQGNAAYERVNDANGFEVDIDYYYNFINTQAGRFTPYAGAGIIITHFGNSCGDFEDIFGIDIDCGATDTNLQVGGGFKKPLESGKEFFVEALIVLGDFTQLIARAGLGW